MNPIIKQDNQYKLKTQSKCFGRFEGKDER